ncbi:MAG: PQQ-binding-like beta-propeller repeat protein [Verrucomicrobia bacterium]|nr:PQQ-binding-like beta-propeller repeat protein [Verrucomicrobiota bacterium]
MLPPGRSSPCIWGDRIFLTGFKSGKLVTLCLGRADGKILWTREVEPGPIEQGSRLGNPAAPTPATDGKKVYVYFGPFGLICYDFDGQERWRKPMPTPVTQHGAGTSPVLADGRLFLACDQDVGSFLLAVNTENGETIWKRDRPAYRRGFSTPLLWPHEKPELILIASTLRLAAYGVDNGTELWSIRGLPNEMVASPVAGEGLIFAGGWTHGSGVSKLPTFALLLEQGDQNHDGQLTRDETPLGPAKQHFLYIDADKNGSITRDEWNSIASIFERSENALLAVRPDGCGDVTATHVVWKQKRGLPYVPSPLLYEGRIYLVKNGGLASCFDARTGEVHYQEERLGALGDYYASPVAADGKICVASQPGVVVICRAGGDLEVLARNNLGEPILATPAIAENKLYVRTEAHLYAFGERSAGSMFSEKHAEEQ